MKKTLSILAFLLGTLGAFSQQKTVTLSLNENSRFFKPELKASADSALKLANSLLNAKEFRDSMMKYSFPCANYDGKCAAKCNDCRNDRINAKTVLDSLYSHQTASLTLILNDCGGGTFGVSSEGINTITSCYYTIDADDDHLPFAYKYAYHICHEYMHIVGFYHFKSPRHRIIKQDVAENTGWIAFYILEKWYNKK